MVNGRERTGGIGGDCYIEPRARRRGLATALHEASFEEMRANGIEFMYGPPTPNNLGALIKAGSRLVTDYRRWVRPLNSQGAYGAAFSRTPTRLEARIAGLPIIALDLFTRTNATGYTLEQVYEFGSEFGDMYACAAATHAVACARDEKYLSWRYHDAPSSRLIPLAVRRNGELAGFVALEKADQRSGIADLFCSNDPKLIDAIVQLVIDYATASGCSRLEISMTEECAVASRLRRHGFIGRDERGFQVAVSDADEQADALLDPRSWHFTEGDQDMSAVFVVPAAD
jgi:GNAT superfamily N-acetyltransferase